MIKIALRHFFGSLMAIVAIIALLLWTEAEAQQTCFQLSPFADVLVVNLSQPAPGVDLFLMPSEWRGPPVYVLGGGGTATFSLDGTRASLALTFHNSTLSFGNNRICRLNASLETDILRGPWALDCMGTTPTDPAYLQAGELIVGECDAIQSNMSHTLDGHSLAGEQ